MPTIDSLYFGYYSVETVSVLIINYICLNWNLNKLCEGCTGDDHYPCYAGILPLLRNEILTKILSFFFFFRPQEFTNSQSICLSSAPPTVCFGTRLHRRKLQAPQQITTNATEKSAYSDLQNQETWSFSPGITTVPSLGNWIGTIWFYFLTWA